MKTPMIRYRPIRKSDGQGGVISEFDAGRTIWGTFKGHQDGTSIDNVDANEDVRVMDELDIAE